MLYVDMPPRNASTNTACGKSKHRIDTSDRPSRAMESGNEKDHTGDDESNALKNTQRTSL
jgi:hypothetical protein